MPRPWQRIVVCAAAALAMLLVSGCEVHGTVDVTSATRAEADLVFTEAEVDCLGLTEYAGLVITGSSDSDGNQTCTARGTLDLTSLEDFGIRLSQTGEYLMLDLAMQQRFAYMPVQVDITFPGAVLDGGGFTADGRGVHLGSLSLATSPDRSRVVALSHRGPQWWVIALAGGLLGGVVLTLAFLFGLRWRRRVHAAWQAEADAAAGLPYPDAAAPEAARETTPEATPVAAQPQGSWERPASDPESDAQYESLFAPPPAGTAAPPAQAASPPEPTPPAAATVDHRMWAPPDNLEGR